MKKKKTNELEKVDEFLVDALELLQNSTGNCHQRIYKYEEKLWEALEVILDLAKPLREKNMKIKLEGIWKNKEVKLNGKLLDPSKSQKVFNHSPDGFNWGYSGSGPAQLALAVLLEVINTVDKSIASNNYHNFKNEVISPLPKKNFSVEIEMDQYIK